jgi:hypothetical protein
MRKHLRLVALIIPMVLVASNSYAAAKAGSPCSKAKLISVNAGKLYTCVKSGKKLVWNKGEVISQTLSYDTAPSEKTPVPTTSPSSTPTVSDAVVAVSAKAPTSFDDLVENYKGIAHAAWSKSREKILASKKADISLKIILGPNTQLTNPEPQAAIDLVTRLYAGYPTSAEINYLAFNYDDREWAVGQMESILPNSGSQWILDTACYTKSTCWGGGAFTNGAGKFLIVETMGATELNHKSGALEAHEFTHIVQQMSFKKARPAQAYLYDPWPPTWYWEGQAHFAQHAAVYFDSFDSYMRERKATAKNLYGLLIYNSNYIQKYFVFNAPEDWRQTYDRWNQYDLGAMFVEILTALKGPDSTMEMWRITGTGVNFPEAFEKVYGISFDKALPVMAKAIALELGRS